MEPSWIDISSKALRANLSLIRSRIKPHVKIISMVKSNAYGHGLDIITPVLAPHTEFFGVNTFSEALAIRNLKLQTQVFIAAPILPSQFKNAQKHRFSLCVHSLEYLNLLSSLHLPLHLHLKINTGMNRLGLSLSELSSALDIISHSSLIPQGIYTHFHSSDTSKTATQNQLQSFQLAVSQAKSRFPHLLAHAANSHAIFKYPESHFDLVRPGLAIYGLYPHPKSKPVLSWYCHPVQSRKISSSESVGYNQTYTADQNHFMSVLPVGYADGYQRRFSNLSHVYCRHHFYPVIGRVSMNFTTISTQNSPLSPKSTIELLGKHVSATSLAKIANTISYEIVSSLNPSLSRYLY